MENYVNENIELKKRLENLEQNNKDLLNQLQKIQATLVNARQCPSQLSTDLFSSDFTDPIQGNNSSNQFGTLLMVLVLFFAVVFGVWSPVITKDQISHTAAAAAASSNRGHAISTSSNNAATVAVCAAATAAAAVASVKIESDSPSLLPAESQEDVDIFHESSSERISDNIRPLSPYATSNLKSRVLLSLNEDEFSNDVAKPGQCFSPSNDQSSLSTNALTARSKTGTAVELTKVRPFMRKISSIQKNNGSMPSTNLPLVTNCVSSPYTNSNSGEYIILNNSNEDAQIIIFNLAQNNGTNQGASYKIVDSNETKLGNPISVKSGNQSMLTLNTVNAVNANYRVINNSQQNAKISTNNPAPKLPTRFRLINNSMVNGHHSPSVIKLNSSS